MLGPPPIRCGKIRLSMSSSLTLRGVTTPCALHPEGTAIGCEDEAGPERSGPPADANWSCAERNAAPRLRENIPAVSPPSFVEEAVTTEATLLPPKRAGNIWVSAPILRRKENE